MTSGDRLEMTLTVTRAAPTPTGWLIASDGSRTAFEGWLQLFGAIEHALAQDPSAANSRAATP